MKYSYLETRSCRVNMCFIIHGTLTQSLQVPHPTRRGQLRGPVLRHRVQVQPVPGVSLMKLVFFGTDAAYSEILDKANFVFTIFQ